METSNPYQTPEADVELTLTQQEFQTPKVFALNGRIGRLRYFAYSVIYTAVAISIVIISMMLLGDTLDESGAGILSMVVVMPVLIVVMKRRLNDLGRSGWLSLLGFIPLLGGFFSLYLLLASGEPSENEYGLAPDKNGKALPVVVGVLCVMFLGIFLSVMLPAYQSYIEQAGSSSAG